jgi:hypothetical protein
MVEGITPITFDKRCGGGRRAAGLLSDSAYWALRRK